MPSRVSYTMSNDELSSILLGIGITAEQLSDAFRDLGRRIGEQNYYNSVCIGLPSEASMSWTVFPRKKHCYMSDHEQ